MFREGNENYKKKSHGRARKNEANSPENSRDREFSLVSVTQPYDDNGCGPQLVAVCECFHLVVDGSSGEDALTDPHFTSTWS